MFVARQERECYTATVRIDGKFTRGGAYYIAGALFAWDWTTIRGNLIIWCRNRAACALLDGNHDTARTWMSRAEKLKEIG